VKNYKLLKKKLKLEAPRLVAALAFAPGESMDRGEARMALRVTCQVIAAANLVSDVDGMLKALMLASYTPLN
jgi:hypothetical protein